MFIISQYIPTRTLLCLICLLAGFAICPAQELAELRKRIETEKDPQKKFHYLFQLSEKTQTINPQEALDKAREAAKLAKQLNNQLGLAKVHTLMGNIYGFQLNRPDKAAVDHSQAFDLYQKSLAYGLISQQVVIDFIQLNVSPLYESLENKSSRKKRKDKRAIRRYQALYTDLSQYLLEHSDDPGEPKVLKIGEKEVNKLNASAGNYVRYATAKQAISDENIHEDLLLANALSQEEIELLNRYVQQLEAELDKNGIDYKKIKKRYIKETNQIRNRVRRLNLLVLRKDSLIWRDSLLARQKIQLVEIEKENLETARKLDAEQYRRNISIISLVSLFLLVIAFVFYWNAKARKLRNLEITEKNKALEEQKEEIASQRDHIENTSDQLRQSYVKITDSLRYAETIQKAVLPQVERIQNLFQDFFVLFRPKEIVSGDFYWFSEMEDQYFVAVVDCTGHGVPGAFMSMIGNTLLNKLVNKERIFDPAEILERLNLEIRTNLHQDSNGNLDGMDIAFCKIENMGNGHYKVTFSGSRRPLYYFADKDNELEELKGGRKSIGGALRNIGYFENEVTYIERGGAIFLSTDGFADQNNFKRKKLGTDRLKKILIKHRNSDFRHLQNELEASLHRHMQDTDQRDDITIMGIRL